MTETEARQVVLLRSFEDPPVAPWSAADRDAATHEAARALGEDAAAERLIAHRAAWGVGRLAQRTPAVASALAATSAPRWMLPAMLVLAFTGGLAVDVIGNARHIDILPKHLLVLLAWNVAVYALLLAHALGGGSGDRTGRPPAWLRALVRRAPALAHSPPLARFGADWLHASAGLQASRLAAALHAGAAVFAVGVIASMYGRGSFFEFRAGWESTFFGARTVHAFVSALLGPASQLSGIALPDASAIAALNLAHGDGENAARWIHLFAVTIVAVIVLPRLALAAGSAWRVRSLRRDFALPLDTPYFQRLLPGRRGAPVVVQVLPYSYRVAPERAAALPAALAPDCAGRPDVRLRDSVPLGAEDQPARWLPALAAESAPLWVALFALTATPERETHGAFVEALASHLPTGTRLQVCVDEADMRQRFGAGTPEAIDRLEQRRSAWRRLMHTLGHEVRFIDLAQSAPPAP